MMIRPLAAMAIFCVLVSTSIADEAMDLLTHNGLAKVGNFYALDVDAKLPARLQEIRAAEAQIAAYTRQRGVIDGDLKHATSVLQDLNSKLVDVDAKMDKARGATASYNVIVEQHNKLVRQVEEGREFVRQKTDTLAKLSAPASPAAARVALANDVEAAQAKYTTLAADAEIKAAIDSLNKTGPHAKLGPSPLFVQQLPALLHQRDVDMKAAVQGKLYHSTLQVVTVLNGSTSVPMIVDSGASVVLITAKLAKQAGVTIKPSDQSLTMITASGEKVQAKAGVIASLSVGQFTAKDVACAVMPADSGADDCLLGATFLQNFLYQVDLGNAQIRLTPISAAVTTASAVATPPSTKPASRPSSQPAAPTSQPAEFELTLNALIDAEDELIINADGITLDHHTFKMPKNVTVNGIAWKVAASNILPASGALEALKNVDWENVRIGSQTGRATVTIKQSADGAHILIADGAPGAAELSLTLIFPLKP